MTPTSSVPPRAAAPLDLPAYPSARRLDLVEDLHGHLVADPYRWLEDASSAETATWSDAQDALWAAYRAQAVPAGAMSQATLTARLQALLGAGFVSAPAWRGDRQFVSRRSGNQEHAVVVVVDRGRERVLIDPVTLDPTGTTTLDAWQPSKEGDLLAYQVSSGGTEESVLHVLDVATGALVDGPIDRARYSPVAWVPGGDSFYYVRRLPPAQLPPDERQYHRRVWLHRVGTDPALDVEVFGAGLDHTCYYGVSVSRDGRWLIVSASAGTAPRTDVWIADLGTTGSAAPRFVPVTVGLDAQTAAWVGRDGRLYLHTNLDAPRGRLAVTDPTDPGVPHWRDLLGYETQWMTRQELVDVTYRALGALNEVKARHGQISTRFASSMRSFLDDNVALLDRLDAAGNIEDANLLGAELVSIKEEADGLRVRSDIVKDELAWPVEGGRFHYCSIAKMLLKGRSSA